MFSGLRKKLPISNIEKSQSDEIEYVLDPMPKPMSLGKVAIGYAAM